MNIYRISSLIMIFSLILSSCKRDDENVNIITQYCKLDIDTIDFTFGIDYDHPEKYLEPGEQSDLSDEFLVTIRDAIGNPSPDIEGVLNVCHWINQHFSFVNAGGNMAGVNTVDELFEIRTFYGCHSQALLLSSVLRKFGFPALMIETADIDWAYNYQKGTIEYFRGHVLSEVFIEGEWILLDNNCTYVGDYDCLNPYIAVMNPNESGLFVFAKGLDVWDYRCGDDSFTYDKLIEFSDNIQCFEDLFFTADYTWDD